MNWTKDKPVFTEGCTLVTAHWDHRLWEIIWLNGYWNLCDYNGEEYGPINDLKADKYLILPKH